MLEKIRIENCSRVLNSEVTFDKFNCLTGPLDPGVGDLYDVLRFIYRVAFCDSFNVGTVFNDYTYECADINDPTKLGTVGRAIGESIVEATFKFADDRRIQWLFFHEQNSYAIHRQRFVINGDSNNYYDIERIDNQYHVRHNNGKLIQLPYMQIGMYSILGIKRGDELSEYLQPEHELFEFTTLLLTLKEYFSKLFLTDWLSYGDHKGLSVAGWHKNLLSKYVRNVGVSETFCIDEEISQQMRAIIYNKPDAPVNFYVTVDKGLVYFHSNYPVRDGIRFNIDALKNRNWGKLLSLLTILLCEEGSIIMSDMSNCLDEAVGSRLLARLLTHPGQVIMESRNTDFLRQIPADPGFRILCPSYDRTEGIRYDKVNI